MNSTKKLNRNRLTVSENAAEVGRTTELEDVATGLMGNSKVFKDFVEDIADEVSDMAEADEEVLATDTKLVNDTLAKILANGKAIEKLFSDIDDDSVKREWSTHSVDEKRQILGLIFAETRFREILTSEFAD